MKAVQKELRELDVWLAGSKTAANAAIMKLTRESIHSAGTDKEPRELRELRELDAWIAEHVMGWKRLKYATGISPGEFFQWNHGAVETRFEGAPSVNFNPSTDPAAAIQVLEKCCMKAGGNVEIAVSRTSGRWFVGIIDWDTEAVDLQVDALALPLAICGFAERLFSK